MDIRVELSLVERSPLGGSTRAKVVSGLRGGWWL